MPILRPDADASVGTWTNAAGSTPLYTEIDETSPSDADYIKSPTDPSAAVCRVTLSNPGGAVDTTTPIVVRYRYRRSGTGSVNIIYRLVENATNRTQIASWGVVASSDTFTTGTYTLSDVEKNIVTDWNDLLLEFEANGENVAPEAYLDWMKPYYFIKGTGNQTVDASERFQLGGPVTSYSLQGTPPGAVTINSSTGVITVDTTADFAWNEVTVRGSNSTGFADVTVELRVLTPTYTIDGGTYSEYTDLPTLSPGDIVVRRATASPCTTQHRFNGASGGRNDFVGVEYLAYPGEEVVMDASSVFEDGFFKMYSTDMQNFTIRGFTFKGAASPVNTYHCEWGVTTWRAKRVIVEQCTFYNFYEGGMYFGGPNGAFGSDRQHTARYNKIYNNASKNRKTDGSGGQVGAGGWGRGIAGDVCDGSTFARNVSYNNWGEGMGGLGSGSAGTGTHGNSLSCTWEDNICWDNWSVHIYMDNMAYSTLQNNKMWGENPLFRKDTGALNLAYPVLIGHEEYSNNPADNVYYLEQATSDLDVINNSYADYLPDAVGGHSPIYYWGGPGTHALAAGSTASAFANSDWTTGNATLTRAQINAMWRKALD